MHFVTGGAYNGKSKWVKEYYELEGTPHLWMSSYQEAAIVENPTDVNKEAIIVIEAAEVLLKHWLNQLDKEKIRNKWRMVLQAWLEWEKVEESRKVIIIGTDMTKGIVPISSEDRIWRDVTGWAYQDTVKKAERVDLIWYGINQQLK